MLKELEQLSDTAVDLIFNNVIFEKIFPKKI